VGRPLPTENLLQVARKETTAARQITGGPFFFTDALLNRARGAPEYKCDLGIFVLGEQLQATELQHDVK
jgi:hypothetical protein